MQRLFLAVPILLLILSSFIFLPAAVDAQPTQHRQDGISGGAEASRLASPVVDYSQLKGSPVNGYPDLAFVPGVGFTAYNFDNNGTETGFLFIPPDPCGAVGTDRVMAVVNVGIECRTKTGTLIFRDALKDFFSPLGAQTLGTFTFDPKIVYDHYEGRFVVVTLERLIIANGDPVDDSRILVAVSKTSTPATATSADWWFMAINSKTQIGSDFYWADYPGFEVDEEAVYITNNMFPFSTGTFGVRLWIIDKGVVGGFYAGSTPSWNVYDPIPATYFALTCQPALVFGAGGAGTNVGTYLVGYSGLTDGTNEYVQIIRIDNPLSSPTFTGQFINVGDLESLAGNIPDAPQSGTATLIEVNDQRALDAVWRNNNLWFTTTIEPNAGYDATNAGQATAHWFRVNTSTPASLSLTDQGNIGGEDIATNTWTFFPALAVNVLGDVKFGFAASASSMFCGAYYAGREAGDPAGTVQAAGVVQAGLASYQRTFGGPRNRWGDYSGAAVDPSDDTTFWVFNEYAETKAATGAPEDGRWGTAWRACLKQQSLDFGDAPDPTYPTLLASNGARHTIVGGVFMGGLIDPEPDGIPHPNALGDDLTNLPDEDGVVQTLPLIPGQPSQFNVTVSAPGWLDAWIDYNLNGSWLDPGELVFSGPVGPGVNVIPIVVPITAASGFTFARFRYNLMGPLQIGGLAPDGEVEDYQYFIEEPQPELDYGDAPDQPYPTLQASNGASHTIAPGVYLGNLIDAEPDGQPHPNALGDDLANQPDEDGVLPVTPFIPGQPAQVDVIASIAGWLDVWFDFNQNGSWLDPGELVYSGNVIGAINPIMFNVPAGATPGITFARFRYNVAGAALPPDGAGPDGEVEDYEVLIDEPQEEIDFGDAPDAPYPTLLANNGARHTIVPGMYMGALIDGELDGQPTPAADGDDIAVSDDEDGVVFTSTLDPTKQATVDVTVSMPGLLDAWIDFDANGVWDASEQIFSSTPVAAGLNSLQFSVPGTSSQAFGTYARFRYSSVGGLTPDGSAPDGEVEDYEVQIEEDLVTDASGDDVPSHYALHDAVPNPFNPRTTLSFSLPTASHVKLSIYDVRGHLVATLVDQDHGPGIYNVIWEGRDTQGRTVASGVYLYRIEAGSFNETKRMVLLK